MHRGPDREAGDERIAAAQAARLDGGAHGGGAGLEGVGGGVELVAARPRRELRPELEEQPEEVRILARVVEVEAAGGADAASDAVKAGERAASLSGRRDSSVLDALAAAYAAAGRFDEAIATVERAMALLTEREREVLRLRYGLGLDRELTLAEIGRRLSISRERVRQIEARAVAKIRAGRGAAA